MLFKRCGCNDQTKCKHPFWYVFVIRAKRYRKSTRTANRQTAGRIEDRRRGAILDNRDEDEQPKVSLKDHVKAYVQHTAKTNTTAYKDQAVLDRFVGSVGDRVLSEVSPFHIERWKRQRADDVSCSTVNRELHIVRGLFSRGVEWGRLALSPCRKVKDYKVDDQRIRTLNEEELKIALTAPGDVALLCRTTLIALARISELLTLRREHIGSSWIEVRRKGGKVHRVTLPAELRELLLARAHKNGFVFGEGDKGNPPSQQTASLRVIRAMRRLNLKGVTHHTMRHTGVTLMLEAGVNPRVIQQLAGWSSLRMLERYGHVRDAEIRRAVSGNAAILERVATQVATDAETVAEQSAAN